MKTNTLSPRMLALLNKPLFKRLLATLMLLLCSINIAHADAYEELHLCWTLAEKSYESHSKEADKATSECMARFHEAVPPAAEALNKPGTQPTEDISKSSLRHELYYLCMKYTQIEKTEVNQMIRDLRGTGYPVDDYFLVPACRSNNWARIKMPLLQLTIEEPCGRAEYPEIVHKYYTLKRKDPAMWQHIINTKNTNGETYLDFIETLKQKGEYRNDGVRACVDKLTTFACSKGAVYSKYPEKCCPAQSTDP